MFNIEKYLQKFSKKIQSVELYKNQIREIIKNNTGIEVPLEEFEISDYVVRIKSSPGVLNKIFIYKNKILDDIKNSTSITITDIR